jgi:hypothetical protein
MTRTFYTSGDKREDSLLMSDEKNKYKCKTILIVRWRGWQELKKIQVD